MRCCVPFCNSNSLVVYHPNFGEKISFHRFPRDEKLKRAWAFAIRRKDINGKLWMPSGKNVAICSRHFRSKDFSSNAERSRLRAGAIPSCFDCYPEHKQKQSCEGQQINECNKSIQDQDITDETFLSNSEQSPVVPGVILSYLGCYPEYGQKQSYELNKMFSARYVLHGVPVTEQQTPQNRSLPVLVENISNQSTLQLPARKHEVPRKTIEEEKIHKQQLTSELPVEKYKILQRTVKKRKIHKNQSTLLLPENQSLSQVLVKEHHRLLKNVVKDDIPSQVPLIKYSELLKKTVEEGTNFKAHSMSQLSVEKLYERLKKAVEKKEIREEQVESIHKLYYELHKTYLNCENE